MVIKSGLYIDLHLLNKGDIIYYVNADTKTSEKAEVIEIGSVHIHVKDHKTGSHRILGFTEIYASKTECDEKLQTILQKA